MNNANGIADLQLGIKFENIGAKIIRFGLALVLIWIGFLKFTAYEAMGIKGLVVNSPFFSWTYPAFGVRGFSNILGGIEIALGILICLKSINPKVSFWGSLGAIVMFILTLTFLLSTPGIIQTGFSFPFISPMPGQFLLKDFVLLGAAVWTAGDALAALKQKASFVPR
ncbi:YkgB family protein [Arachidicoccus sp.]|uniref:YkgB family protein n=1 Tax=Arachidicoccus sp. TaxID=1872624 RepID=UPI003D238F9E